MDIRGINAGDVPAIKTQVQNYKARIDAVLDKIVAWDNTSYHTALKGTGQEKTIKTYVDNTIAEMKKITKYIDEFEAGIDAVAKNYVARSDAVNTAAVTEGTVEGAGELAGVQPFSE